MNSTVDRTDSDGLSGWEEVAESHSAIIRQRSTVMLFSRRVAAVA